MSGARITIDGLWRCLCPSIDAATFVRAVSTPYRPRPKLRAEPPCTTGRLFHTTKPRRLPDGSARQVVGEEANKTGKYPPGSAHHSLPGELHLNRDEGPSPPLPEFDRELERLAFSEQHVLQDLSSLHSERTVPAEDQSPSTPSQPPPDAPAKQAQASSSRDKHSPRRPKPPTKWTAIADTKNIRRILKISHPYEIPSDVANEDVFEALRITRDMQRPRWQIITVKLVKHLLATGMPPNTFIYETLLMAHATPEGSADTVKRLLGEMRQNKIAWSSTAYHSALRALAIHPDYLLRADILRQMKERWIEVSTLGHQYIAIGLLRDEQYELALEKLEDMVRHNEPIEPWVFDIFIYVFGKLEYVDEALRIARHRQDKGYEVPVNVWCFLLDLSSKNQNHDATTYIWARTVPQGILNPSDGICLNILNMAASYGNADLATQVLQFLAERGTKLGAAHYEAVADAYCVQGNIDRAIEALCIMHAAGVEVKNASMGSLSQTLRRNPSLVDSAILALTNVRKKHPISVVVFNAILNQLARSADDNATSIAQTPEEAYAKAIDLFRRIREFVVEGPNWETFRILLWGCTDPHMAQFLAKEMTWFGIRQNPILMELMFQVQVIYDGPSYRAKRYFYKLAPHYRIDQTKVAKAEDIIKSRKWQRFFDLSIKLVKRLISERDPEAWHILAYCQSNGLEGDVVKQLKEEVESGKIVLQGEEEEEDGEVSEDKGFVQDENDDDQANDLKWGRSHRRQAESDSQDSDDQR